MDFKNFFKKRISRKIYQKNQNRRIWNEIFKVLLASDLIVYILDGRDPLGTWCGFLEKKINKLDKKLIFILNKSDLVPKWVVTKWIEIFSFKNITIAFHSVLPQILGKGSILNIIRQIKKTFFPKKKNLIIGVIGYPNVGKSSFINALNNKKVVSVSPKSGETKIWQFIKLLNQIFIIDSPGIIPNLKLDKIAEAIRGNIRMENIYRKNFELSRILKKINNLNKKKSCAFKNKKFINFNTISSIDLSKIEKGGTKNTKQKINFELRKFIKGEIPWYAPFPCIKKNKFKIFRKKKWFLQKNLLFLINITHLIKPQDLLV